MTVVVVARRAATMAGRASGVHPLLMRCLPFFNARKKQGIRFISFSKCMCEPLSTPLMSSASESDTSIPGAKVLEIFKEEFEIGSLLITLETGKIARFANGSVVISIGDTKVLSTVTCSKGDSSHDFLPLTVDYQEKQFAQGVIPNTFMRREGAPKERELLCGRIIDRPIRPLFPPGFFHEVQVMASVLSADGKQDPDVMAANASSVALMLSDIPWRGPIGVVRIGRICGEFIVNPSVDELSLSDLNLLYACTRDKTLMMDVQAREISERDLEAALRLAHPEAVKYLDPQIRLADKTRKRKKEYKLSMVTQSTLEKVRNLAETSIEKVFTDPSYGKFERGEALENITENTRRSLEEECDVESLRLLSKAVDTVRKGVVRKRIFKEGIRVDGRKVDEVRPLYCEAGNLPVLHGSSLFSRGDTQVLCTVTLGSPLDAQRLVSVVGPTTKRFMLHYSFPPFSINEVGKRIGLNRREVGHGTLAEKSLLAVLPPEDELLYTVRVNSEVMASDGSTSMASVCGASMALMDAGIPLRESVAGISVGLVSDIDPVTGVFKDYRILTDILGLEDHLGDMDFKVSGTRQGITAIQLDIKPAGIPLHIILEALEPARKGRIQIIDRMEQEINSHRIQEDRNLPRIVTLKINSDSLRRVIGPMGTVKKQLEDETGARILINNGSLTVVAKNSSMMETVQEKIESMIGREIEVGGLYKGVVTSVKEYGAFVEFNGGRQEGLLHISELSHDSVTRVSDVVSVGQQLSLMCIGLDVRGNIKLSLKATLPRPVSSVKEHRPFSALKEPNPFTEKATPSATDSRCPFPTSSVSSVVIRSTAECDEAEKLLSSVKIWADSRAPDGTERPTKTGGDILLVSAKNDVIPMKVRRKPKPPKQPQAQKEGESKTHDLTLGAGKSKSPKRTRPVKHAGTKSTGGKIPLAPITTADSETLKRYQPGRAEGGRSPGERIRTEPLSKKNMKIQQGGRMTGGGILLAPGKEGATRKREKAVDTGEKPLRVGTCVKATVSQIRPRGLVLNLGLGLQGIFRFEGDERAKFEVGRTIHVVCTGYSEKGVPVMKAHK